MPAEPAVWPKTVVVNARVRVRFGYADCHAEIDYDTKIPFVNWYTLRLEQAEMPFVDQVFKVQTEWVALSKMRPGCKALIDIPISPKVTAKVGFEDRRVEIAVKIALVNYTIAFSEGDETIVRDAFAEAKRLNALSPSERFAWGIK